MRYAKCDKCNKDIAGQPKIVMSYISETKGKHRNAEKNEMVRFCVDCGKKAFLNIFPLGVFNWDRETYKEKKFNLDKKDGEIQYNKIKVKKKKYIFSSDENNENDAICLLLDSTMYQSKKALLLQKIRQIADKYRRFGLTINPDDIEEVIDSYDISSRLADILEKLGTGINRFMLNDEKSYIMTERTHEDLDLTNIMKWLNTVEHHYIDKMNDELKDAEYKTIVINSLKAIYDSHNKMCVRTDVFIPDQEKTIIDLAPVKKDGLISE